MRETKLSMFFFSWNQYKKVGWLGDGLQMVKTKFPRIKTIIPIGVADVTISQWALEIHTVVRIRFDINNESTHEDCWILIIVDNIIK